MPPHALRVHSCDGHFSPKLEGNLCNYHVPISQMKLPQDLISLMKKTHMTGLRNKVDWSTAVFTWDGPDDIIRFCLCT